MTNLIMPVIELTQETYTDKNGIARIKVEKKDAILFVTHITRMVDDNIPDYPGDAVLVSFRNGEWIYIEGTIQSIKELWRNFT